MRRLALSRRSGAQLEAEMTAKHKAKPARTKPAREPSPPAPPTPRLAYRVAEFAALIGMSKASVYRGVNDGSLLSRQYRGVTLIEGFADKAE
jgi:hypothetical protein